MMRSTLPGTTSFGGRELEISGLEFLEMLKAGNVLRIRVYDGCGQETRRSIPLAGSGVAITKMLDQSRF